MTAIRIPDLDIKLIALIRRGFHPEISNYTQLAERLGIAKSNINGWRNSESIPDKWVIDLCRLFTISQDVLRKSCRNVEEFCAAAWPTLASWWQLLEKSREDGARLSLIVTVHPPLPLVGLRFSSHSPQPAAPTARR